VTDVKAAAAFYPKGIRLCQTGNHEWTRRQSNTCRAHAPGYDINVGARNSADGFPQCENNRRLTREFVSANRERRQGGRKGREARGRAQGAGDGYVLGRPLWNRRRSRGLYLDGSHPHCRTHASGNEKEDEGANGQPASRHSEWLVSAIIQGPPSFFLKRFQSGWTGWNSRRPKLV